ncbi:MAG: ATP-binding protein [Bacilli bacterium]|jgi:DNA helicase HerA-like ATPase|nr:ATP-binding protein [Bacilli bacterium]
MIFGKILYISDNIAHVENVSKGTITADLMNIHVIFEENDQRILGEVIELNDNEIKIRFLGEYMGKRYVNGVIRKPLLSSKIRVINGEELVELVGALSEKSFVLGSSATYKGFQICPDINSLFSNHLAIFGNSGSGKSCGVSRIIQNIFSNPKMTTYNANMFFFDAYGEYKNAFGSLNKINPNYSYKFITTNPQEPTDYLLKIPVNLLTLDDVALLLQASTHSQLPILERSIKYAKIFSSDNEEVIKYKNHLIAKALIAILFSNMTTSYKKNEIFKVIEVCHTKEFNFDSVIPGLGYTRSFSECFEIDSNGNFGESVLITEYILKHIDESIVEIKEPENSFYTLRELADALEFVLISEGFQGNQMMYNEAMILQVRLNTIISGPVNNYFDGSKHTSTNEFINELVKHNNGRAQIVNINLEDIDDAIAKVIVKIISKLLFDYSKGLKERASIPFHLFLEEAHRYIQQDTDTFLLGYNIFDRIAKEGRKYGVMLDIISQRPVEISDTVIAQCSNFLIFKMTHPKDIKYIEEMLPNISSDVIEKQKVLQPGNCVAFGSAFKIPMICKLEMPDPMPYSTNCNVSGLWGEEPKMATQVEVTPVENNYVTEGVATNALEESMQADTIFNGDNTSNSGADAEFNPMSGMGEI